MKGARSFHMTGVVAIAYMASSGPAFAGLPTVVTEQERPSAIGDWHGTIVAQVDDYAEIGSRDLAAAEEFAARVYEAIGVRLIWVHGEVPLQDPRGLRINLRLLSRTMAELKISKERIKGDVLGQANSPSRNIYIFFHRIVPVAVRYGQNYARMLGLVMAHEMGHILLPAVSHSESGIMSAKADVWTRSVRFFTADQGAAIRSMLIESAQSNPSERSDGSLKGTRGPTSDCLPSRA